jgi:hypothetical protein
MASGGMGAVMINETPIDEFYNLPFMLAYSVLEDAIDFLDVSGKIAKAGWKLGPRMEVAKTVLTWIDFALVDDGREKRNDLAHEAKLLPRKDCIHYIEAIGAELKAWRLGLRLIKSTTR